MQHALEVNTIIPDIFKYILNGLKEKYDQIAGKRYFENSQNHYLRLRIMQFYNFALDQIDLEDLPTIGEWIIDHLLSEPHQISIKILMQWLYTRILIKTTTNYEELFENLLAKTKTVQGAAVSTMFPIFYHLLKYYDKDASKIMNLLGTLAMGPSFGIRYSAQVKTNVCIIGFSVTFPNVT